MRINVLGPVVVLDDDGEPLPTGAPKELAVLALLAIRGGDVASTGALFDVLWEDEAPPSATKTLQGNIARIRKNIGHGAIERAGAGYRITLQPEDIDACRFDSLRRKGRQLLHAQRPREAVDVLGSAAALWRGEPAPELRGTSAGEAVRHRLVEAHKELLDDLFEARLELGQGGDLVVDLEDAVRDDPYRERRWRQLMWALYQAGRQGDALAAFQRARRELIDGIGIEPGRDLRDLERRIIDQDPQLAATQEPPTVRAEGLVSEPTALPSGVVTFLLTDIEGSTRMWDRAQSAMAEALVQHDEIIEKVIAAHDGHLLKHHGEGDSTFSVFTNCRDAVLAASEIRSALRAAVWPEPIRIRVRQGVATGEAELRGRDYFGPVVNRAARIRSLAAPGDILAANTSHDLAVDALPDLTFDDRGEHQLKGITRPERVWALAADLSSDDTEPDFGELEAEIVSDLSWAESSRLSAFVGRSDAYGSLYEHWLANQATRDRSIVLVSGDPGIGKTRLVGEFAKRVARRGAVVLHGRCEVGTGGAYQPFSEALGGYVANCPLPLLRYQVAGNGALLERIVPHLVNRLGDVGRAHDLDPDSEQYRTFDAVSDFIEAIAAECPLLIIVDDLHWAAAATIQLLLHLARAPSGHPALVVGTYRGVDLTADSALKPLIGELHRTERLHTVGLRGLDRDAVRQLVESAAEHELDDEIRGLADALCDETGGNPFFLGTMLAHLVDTQTVIRRGNRWHLARPLDDAGLPEGVKEVLGLRLQQLDPASRDALQVAAVIGPAFEIDHLSALLDKDGDAVLDAVEAAASTGLIREADGYGVFRFAHDLVRQTLLDEISTTRCVRLHWRLALVLNDRPTRDLDEAAFHAFEGLLAGDAGTAVDIFRAAAIAASQRAAYDAGARHLDHALVALGELPSAERAIAEVLIDRAVMMLAADRPFTDPAFVAACVSAEEAAIRLADPGLIVQAFTLDDRLFPLIEVAVVDRRRSAALERAIAGLPNEARDESAILTAFLAEVLACDADYQHRASLIEDSLSTLSSDTDPSVRDRVIRMCAMASTDPRQAERGRQLANTAMSLNDPTTRTTGLFGLTFHDFWDGNVVEILERTNVAEEIAQALRLRGVMLTCRTARVAAAGATADVWGVRELAITSEELTERTTTLGMTMNAQVGACVAWWSGVLHDTDRQILACVTRVPELRSMLCMAAGLSRAWAGDEEGARELIRTEVPHLDLETCGGLVAQLPSYFAVALCTELGLVDEGRPAYEALQAFTADFIANATGFMGPSGYALGRYSILAGEFEQAEAELRWAHDRCVAKELPAWRVVTEVAQAELAARQGDAKQASELIANAREANVDLDLPRITIEADRVAARIGDR